jgi:hypothetical protein
MSKSDRDDAGRLAPFFGELLVTPVLCGEIVLSVSDRCHSLMLDAVVG